MLATETCEGMSLIPRTNKNTEHGGICLQSQYSEALEDSLEGWSTIKAEFVHSRLSRGPSLETKVDGCCKEHHSLLISAVRIWTQK